MGRCSAPRTNEVNRTGGDRKKFRVRHARTVLLEPCEDGLGITRDAQTARPQAFRTSDGWFAYNLAQTQA